MGVAYACYADTLSDEWDICRRLIGRHRTSFFLSRGLRAISMHRTSFFLSRGLRAISMHRTSFFLSRGLRATPQGYSPWTSRQPAPDTVRTAFIATTWSSPMSPACGLRRLWMYAAPDAVRTVPGAG